MKGKWTNRMTVLAVCAVPYVFLGMYGDAVYGRTLGYLPMLAWMGWESRMAVRPCLKNGKTPSWGIFGTCDLPVTGQEPKHNRT